MAIKIECDTKDEAGYIGEAINSCQAMVGPIPYLNPNNVTISIGEENYNDWCTDEDGEIVWDFYGLDELDYEDDEYEEDE